jgi:hypothetical protein
LVTVFGTASAIQFISGESRDFTAPANNDIAKPAFVATANHAGTDGEAIVHPPLPTINIEISAYQSPAPLPEPAALDKIDGQARRAAEDKVADLEREVAALKETRETTDRALQRFSSPRAVATSPTGTLK